MSNGDESGVPRILEHDGVESEVPRVLLKAPERYMGLGIPDLYTTQGVEGVLKVVQFAEDGSYDMKERQICAVIEMLTLEVGMGVVCFKVSIRSWLQW